MTRQRTNHRDDGNKRMKDRSFIHKVLSFILRHISFRPRTGVKMVLPFLVSGFLLLAPCSLQAQVQRFYNLTADQVRIDTLLPRFTYSVPLPQNYQDSIYTASIAYPEFISMSQADIKRYETISGEPLPALPIVEQHVSVNRKQASLDITFVPLVQRDGRYMKLVSFMVKVDASPNFSQRGNHHGARSPLRVSGVGETSVLSTGTWAKIRVPASGLCALTDDFIRKAGFSNTNKVKVYGYGGALQPEALYADYIYATDDLQEVPTCTVGGKRVFWAQGPVSWDGNQRIRNPYSQYGYYFLTESEGEPLTTDEQSLWQRYLDSGEADNTLYEVDDFAWFHSGRNLYDAQLYTVGQAKEYTLTLPAGATSGTLTVVLTAYDTQKKSTATISLNGTECGTMSMGISSTYIHAVGSTQSFKVNNLQGSNKVRITQTGGGEMRLDYIALHADQQPTTRDLTTLPMVTAEFVSVVANQNHHADEPADMVIIIPASRKLLAQAERLKELHMSKDSLRVRIIPADELFNEFSSGTPDANAYRRYLRMLYERAANEADMPRFLMLFGDGAWDNRMLSSNWKNYSPDDFLLCYESENSFSATLSYVTDDYYCMLDDGEGGNLLSNDRADVAVGRFPARTEQEAKILVDKLEDYVSNRYAGSWQNQICVMGDDGNQNQHMQDADLVAKQVEKQHPGYQVKRIMWDAYERTTTATGNRYPDVTRLIKQQMQQGALIMNYSGHGAAGAISHEYVLRLNDFADAMSNRLPLWITASCDIMPFDGQEENIGETAMFNRRGGAVAFFGTTRTVYASYNSFINLAFMGEVLNDIPIGEAVRLAKNALIISKQDTSVNKLHYVLLGDPALKLATPTLSAVVDDINGAPVSSGEPLTLKAGTTVTVRGHIEQSSLNGVVTASVRDAEEEITCRLNDSTSDMGADVPFVYHDRTKTLYQGSDSVQNGRFAFQFIVPQDISYSDGSGLINVYALSSDGSLRAHGTCDHFRLGGADVVKRDSVGPKIYCYLNSETFVNGGKVNTTPYFVATISDDDGINATGNSIGHDLELIIDGETARTYVLNDYFQYDFGSFTSGTVGYSLPALDYGCHRLQFRAWDTQNNSTTTQLDFEVCEGLEPVFFDVECTRNPATTTTSFRILHDRTGSEMDFILDVFDMSGRHIWQHAESGVPTDNTYTIDWNLTQGSGSRISTGVYLYRIRISSDGSSYASKAKKIIVISNK